MGFRNIFKIIGIVNCLLLQLPSVQAMNNNNILESNIISESNINNNVLRNDMNQDKPLSGDILINQGYKKKYPSIIITGHDFHITEKSNVKVEQYNNILFRNSNIAIDSPLSCFGNINLNLDNNSNLIINNNRGAIELFEMGADIILNNNSSLIFYNNNDENVINLFSNETSKARISLLNGSSVHFNNKTIVALNDGSKILISNGKLNCTSSTFNMSKNSQIISKNGECSFDNSECNLDNAEIILNDNSKLQCNNNSKIDSKNSYIALNQKSIINLENSDINLESDKIDLNNESELNSNNNTIKCNNETLTVYNSACNFDNSTMDLGASTINISGDDVDESQEPNDKMHFTLNNSSMKSDSFDFMFNIKNGYHMLVRDSKVDCLGRLIKLGSSKKSDIPLVQVLGNSYFIWDDFACDQGYDIGIDDTAIVLKINKLIFDDLKSQTPTITEVEDNNEEE